MSPMCSCSCACRTEVTRPGQNHEELTRSEVDPVQIVQQIKQRLITLLAHFLPGPGHQLHAGVDIIVDDPLTRRGDRDHLTTPVGFITAAANQLFFLKLLQDPGQAGQQQACVSCCMRLSVAMCCSQLVCCNLMVCSLDAPDPSVSIWC